VTKQPLAEVHNGRIGDRVLLAVLALNSVAALAIASSFGGVSLALEASALALMIGASVAWLAPGSIASRLFLTLANAAMVALHIQLGRGTIEFHFGVFVLLAMLLVYRDWVIILVAAGFFAVHHALFDRLQLAGFAVYCMPEPDLLKVVLHAAYVVIQSATEVAIVMAMRAMAREGNELSALLDAMHDGEQLRLNLRDHAATSVSAQRLQRSLSRMGALIAAARETTRSVVGVSQEIAESNLDLSARSESAAASLQQTAQSMTGLSSGISEVADVARESAALMERTAEVAARGGALVSSLVDAMGEIQASARRIGDIIGTVDGIAFQTNLLALNAAVEAARAGEQGRGFAVVASEVRRLAQHSAQAAKEVEALVRASLASVERGTGLVGEAGNNMAEIVEGVNGASAQSHKLSGITVEQARNVDQVHRVIAELDEATQRNTALVEETAAASTTLSERSQLLAENLVAFVD
jgi:methyl-accepting chemotaxis protein